MRKAIILSMAALFLSAGCASMPAKTADHKERAGMVALKITEAERLGAKECAPRTLAKAKVALDHVIHEVEEGYYHPAWLEPDIAAAEKAAEGLLAERRFAAKLGTRFRCTSGIRNEPAAGSLQGG
ncbi:MAG: hypothetical protein WC899_05125 [bacterium]|jgi:hypothetical protein